MFLNEYSWGVKKRSARRADNLAAIYEPFTEDMTAEVIGKCSDWVTRSSKNSNSNLFVNYTSKF
jgi:hypothetical protein